MQENMTIFSFTVETSACFLGNALALPDTDSQKKGYPDLHGESEKSH